MKINRPNMADLSRTFASSGESDSRAAPEVSIDFLPSMFPTIEACRPVARARAPSSGVPVEESQYLAFSANVAAGAASISAPQFTLRRGIWRLFFQGTVSISGAIANEDTHAILALVGPDGLFGPGLHLLQAQIGNNSGSADIVIHFPTDEWTVSFQLVDPITALSVNRFRGYVYACHLL